MQNLTPIKVMGGVPEPIQYLHRLISNGHGDTHDRASGKFSITVINPDRDKYPSLKGVSTVYLEYEVKQRGD